MKWIREESAVCLADENITVRSVVDKSVLFSGFIRDFRLVFVVSPDNTKDNNTIECSVRGLAECKFYPFNILGHASDEFKGQYGRIWEDKSVEAAPDKFSHHAFSFEKRNGEVLFTAKLLKPKPEDWFERHGGLRRRPPYDLRNILT